MTYPHILQVVIFIVNTDFLFYTLIHNKTCSSFLCPYLF